MQNREDAEDLLQETYIRIRMHAGQYTDQGKPLAWMFTIARDLALMRLRESKRSSYENIENLNLQEDGYLSTSETNAILISVDMKNSTKAETFCR